MAFQRVPLVSQNIALTNKTDLESFVPGTN